MTDRPVALEMAETPLEVLERTAREAESARVELEVAQEAWDKARQALTDAWAAIPRPGLERDEARERAGRPVTPVLTKRQAHLLELLRAGWDRRQVAGEWNVSYQSVDGMLNAIGKKGLLPADVIALLPATFSKWARA